MSDHTRRPTQSWHLGRSTAAPANERPAAAQSLFSCTDFVARLAALVPKPRVNLTRFHGVFAPNSTHRARVTLAKRGRGAQRAATGNREELSPGERRAAMTWAQRLKRVFGIDIETCPACGGAVRIIACIEDPKVIEKILSHLDAKAPEPGPSRLPPCRAPPQAPLFGSPQQPAPCAGDTGQTRKGKQASLGLGRGRAHTRRAPGLDELGTAPQACFWYRHRDLSGLRRGGQDRCMHRRSGGDREDSRSPRPEGHLRTRSPVATLPSAAVGRVVRPSHRPFTRPTPSAAT